MNREAGDQPPRRVPSETERARQLLGDAFTGPIEPVRTSVAYQLALVLVAAIMLLLPVLYVSLAGAVADCAMRPIPSSTPARA